ncbi:MAG: hypothetical protein ACKO96_40490 [Flammeovirgaceae bacterium]
MNKFIVPLLFFAATQLATAQSVTVKKHLEKIKGETAEGYATDLEGKRADVNTSLNKFLKEIGKIKFFSSDPVVITSPNISGTVYPKGVIYALTSQSGNVTTVWLGVRGTEWESKDVDGIQKELEKLTYQFGIRFYRERMQAQIDETQQAVDAVEKQSLRFINQGKELTTKLTNNELEKIKLEKALEANKLENEAIKIRIENNKKAQDSIDNVAIQVKKVKESQTEKLRKIN